MPSVDASKDILSAAAGYQAGDWAEVGAQASLDIQALAEFSRGFDLQLGAEAIVRLDGAIREYLAADLAGEANAAARVRGQVQVPLDLFNEAGLAVRLQAIAEVSAGVTLAIGLKAGDFLTLAGADDQMRGVPLELLKVFLAEFTIQGGVMAKASASAMAYANMAMTGRLIPSGNQKPGFTIAAEAGLGLKAGAGFRVLARFGVDDPRRWLRRSIDIAVDESITVLLPELPDAIAPIMKQLRVPAKIALRSAFEAGIALTERGGSFSPGDGPGLANRCVQVALEEVQRHIFEAAITLALETAQAELKALGIVNRQAWQNVLPQRQALAKKLDEVPEYPLEGDQDNLNYWVDLLEKMLQLAIVLTPEGTIPAALAHPLTMLWSAVQLAFITLKRISNAGARLNLMGMSPTQSAPAFDGALPDPPRPIRRHLNTVLGRSQDAAVAQVHAVDFLVTSLTDEMDRLGPDVQDAVRLVVGARSENFAESLSIILSNIGAFVPDSNGNPRATTSLAVIRDALLSFFDNRIEAELRPALLDLAGNARDTALFADEVLLGSLRTIVHTLFDRFLSWSSGSDVSQRAIRELCSGIVLGFCGRCLVVCVDVISTRALTSLRGELRDLATHVNDPSGIAVMLSQLTGLDRAFVAEVMEETLLISSDVFLPMPEERRARLRALLYEVIDTGSGLTVTDLEKPDFMPNRDAAQELALMLGEEIAGNVARLIQSLLTRVGSLILEELLEMINDLQDAVEEWLAGLASLLDELGQLLAKLVQEIAELGIALDKATDKMLGSLSDLLNRLDTHQDSRIALRVVVRDVVYEDALAVLRSNEIYKHLPRRAKALARSQLRTVIESILATGFFDIFIGAFAAISGEMADFVDDIQAIEPGDDVEAAVMELFLDRLEDAMDDAFGGHDPRIEVGIDIPNLLHISLGTVRIRLSSLITNIRQSVRALQGIRDRVHQVAVDLLGVFQQESLLAAAEAEEHILRGEQTRAQANVNQSRCGQPVVELLQPAPGAAVRGDVELRLILRNVTPAILDVAPPSQQRVFVWINQRLLPLERFSSKEVGTAVDSPPDLADRIRFGETAAGRVTSLSRARGLRGGARTSVNHKNGRGLQVRTREASKVQVTRLGGKLLGPDISTGLFYGVGRNLRPSEMDGLDSGLSGILLSTSIGTELLAEGINTITIAVLPGGPQQRVEHSTAFLWKDVPGAQAPVVMPDKGELIADVLPAFARQSIAQRVRGLRLVERRPHSNGAGKQGSPGLTWRQARDRKNKVHQALFPLEATRRKAVQATTKELQKRMHDSIHEIEKLRMAVRTGALRPKPIDRDDQPGHQKDEGKEL